MDGNISATSGENEFLLLLSFTNLLRTIYAYSIYTAVKRITLLIQSLTNSFDTLIFESVVDEALCYKHLGFQR